MNWPVATRQDHLQFCRIEQWREVRNATGGKVGAHITFVLPLDDGRILRTRISHPPTKSKTYGKSIWAHILRDQLDVTEEQFWDCVKSKILPPRSVPPPPRQGIPADLYRLLTVQAGLPESDVRAMTKAEAVAAATAYWQRGEG